MEIKLNKPDWSKVPVNAKVSVYLGGCCMLSGHFAAYNKETHEVFYILLETLRGHHECSSSKVAVKMIEYLVTKNIGSCNCFRARSEEKLCGKAGRYWEARISD